MAPKKPLPSPPLKDDHKLSCKKQPDDKVADEEDSSEEENEEDQRQTPSKKPPPSTPISNPKPASKSGTESGSDSGSGSKSETDVEPEPTPPPKPIVKPLASKPMKPQPKTQTQAQTTSAPAKSGIKRAAENEEDQPQTRFKKPPPSTPISNPKSASKSGTESGSDSGFGSELETDPEPGPTPPPHPKVKPLASKPIKPQPKAQTQAQTTFAPARSGTKCAAENGNDSNRSKKKKTIVVACGSDDKNEIEEGVKLTGEDSKKSNQRIFSEEDELTILKGLAEFTSKTRTDLLKKGTAFHRFVKKSLFAEFNVEQMNRKIRGLKYKYETKDSFTKPHDKKAFELFKKVWGNDGAFKKVWGNDGANEAEEKGKVNGKMVKGVTKEASGSVKKAIEKETVKVESDADTSLILTELFRFDAGGLSASSKDLMKRGLELMEESKRAEFEEKWRQMQIAELELFKKRSHVVTDCSNLILRAINISSK